MSHFLEYSILEFYLQQHSLMHAHHLVPTLYFGNGLILGKQCMVEWKLTKFLVNNMFNTDNKDNKWKWHRKLHKLENYVLARATGCHNSWHTVCHIPGSVLHVCYRKVLFFDSDSLYIGRKNIFRKENYESSWWLWCDWMRSLIGLNTCAFNQLSDLQSPQRSSSLQFEFSLHEFSQPKINR